MRQPTINEFHRQFGIAEDSEKKAYRARYAAGRALLGLRESSPAGADWWEWYDKNSVRSRKDAIKCMAIAAFELAGLDDDERGVAIDYPDLQDEITRLRRRSGIRFYTSEQLDRRRAQTRERVKRFRERTQRP